MDKIGYARKIRLILISSFILIHCYSVSYNTIHGKDMLISNLLTMNVFLMNHHIQIIDGI